MCVYYLCLKPLAHNAWHISAPAPFKHSAAIYLRKGSTHTHSNVGAVRFNCMRTNNAVSCARETSKRFWWASPLSPSMSHTKRWWRWWWTAGREVFAVRPLSVARIRSALLCVCVQRDDDYACGARAVRVWPFCSTCWGGVDHRRQTTTKRANVRRCGVRVCVCVSIVVRTVAAAAAETSEKELASSLICVFLPANRRIAVQTKAHYMII